MLIFASRRKRLNELIQLVTQKTGISQSQATTAVETVVNFLKAKLPPAVSGQIDSLISGQESGAAAGIAGKIGDVFGKK